MLYNFTTCEIWTQHKIDAKCEVKMKNYKLQRQVKFKSMSIRNILQQIVLKLTRLVQFIFMDFNNIFKSEKLPNILFFCIFQPIIVYYDQGIQVCEPKSTTTQINQDSSHRKNPSYFNSRTKNCQNLSSKKGHIGI